MINEYEEVLVFWFDELQPNDWFSGSPEIDAQIRQRFGEKLVAAKKGELFPWRKTIRGRLAEIIVLDQFSRNSYRNDPRAYDGDAIAVTLAQEAVVMEEKVTLNSQERSFLYMPFMHSESLIVQEKQSMVYFKEPGLEKRYRYAQEHYQTIKKFGRFPYRNKVLGRKSTQQELIYLKKTMA